MTICIDAAVGAAASLSVDPIRTLSEWAEETHTLMKKDRVGPVVIIVVAIALILLVGFAAAWYISCRNVGKYPALDMPSFQSGGTWKAYCKK